MVREFGPFKLYTKTPNAIASGYLYTCEVDLVTPYRKKRMVRVYLPENFDSNKKYPVLYMADGQNIVDKYTTSYGEWNIDEIMKRRIQEGKNTFIVVGIDCPPNEMERTLEYSFAKPKILRKYLDNDQQKIKDYYIKTYLCSVISVVKKLVDENFPTLTDKTSTCFGGSSMGGIVSTYAVLEHSDVFGMGLIFSPAYYLYSRKSLEKMILSYDFNKLNDTKLYLYAGGTGYEENYPEPTTYFYNFFNQQGIKKENIKLDIRKEETHSEESWNKAFPDAADFLFGK